MLDTIKIIFLILILLIAVGFLVLWVIVTVFGAGIDRTDIEVMEELERILDPSDESDWDAFLSIPINDEYLDSIRERSREILFDSSRAGREDKNFVPEPGLPRWLWGIEKKDIDELRGFVLELHMRQQEIATFPANEGH